MRGDVHDNMERIAYIRAGSSGRVATVAGHPAVWRGLWAQSPVYGRCCHCGGLTARGKCQACGWMVACAWCGSVRTPDGWQHTWHRHEPERTSHGICVQCWIEQRRQLCA